MTKQQALEWFERRAESITLSEKCAEAENVAMLCIVESIAREPRLLGLEEVKAIALRMAHRIVSTEAEPVWLEQNDGSMTRLVPALISWWYMEGIDEDETEFEFIAEYFGTDFDDTLNYLDYGTRWRCWSGKPSKDQRRDTPWE